MVSNIAAMVKMGEIVGTLICGGTMAGNCGAEVCQIQDLIIINALVGFITTTDHWKAANLLAVIN